MTVSSISLLKTSALISYEDIQDVSVRKQHFQKLFYPKIK